jgi:plastocyanin
MGPLFAVLLTAGLWSGSMGQDHTRGGSASKPTTFDVSGTIRYSGDTPLHRAIRDLGRRTVVWLAPADPQSVDAPAPGSFTMVQKDKEFHPRLLVVPVGSTVSFPNADPFFHNVFSLFNGRRFDLGLYQSGQTRTITFSREGVSYIFCNIHPEMSAVIISLKTPYYGSPGPDGSATLRGVPEGTYRLQVWSEFASPEVLRSLSRTVKIDRGNLSLGTIEIRASAPGLEEHLNKFGLPYDTHSVAPY